MCFAGQSLPPRSSSSTPISQPGSMNPSMPFASSPNTVPSQNPLSLIMSQMSKYAMPSSAPLYHDAIKTIATSDDEMLPDRPLLAGVNMGGRNTKQVVRQKIYFTVGQYADKDQQNGPSSEYCLYIFPCCRFEKRWKGMICVH